MTNVLQTRRATIEVNNQIYRINGMPLASAADRNQMFDDLFKEFPKAPPRLYETEEIVLPGETVRDIVTCSQCWKANLDLGHLTGKQWPIFKLVSPDDDTTLNLMRASGIAEERIVLRARLIEVLGPSRITYIRGFARVRTSAPLRIYVDTPEQARKNGEGTSRHNPKNLTGYPSYA